MVRFWPFGGDDNSPGSFERILVKLASQIQTTSSKLAALRQRSRRYKALFTIYSVIGYILFCIIIVLVVGRQNIGLQESGGLIGGPVGIYLVRKLLDFYYGRRIASTESKLEELQMEQRTTIEKLKAATKYSTTQSLIEKYGDTTTGVAVTPKQENKKVLSTGPVSKGPLPQPHQPSQQQQIPPLPPMLTPDQIRVQQQLLAQQKAGIPPQYGQGQPGNAQPRPPTGPQTHQPNPPQILHMQGQTQPPSQQHLQPEEATAPKWYDRILDVVLGEDEMSAKNRLALICKNCKMVNGLAPPGTRSLDDMDQWGCARCGTMNGGRKNPVLVPEDGPETESETEFAPESPEPKHHAARVTRSKTKREDPIATDDNGGKIVKQESEEDEPEVLKPKSKAKVRGRKKA
ncbi:hypothetical protein K440DRAFT_659067 [Wilcoxina mikolae CBS 423.85]|nr:hypothetical protein K440DRAFT_659067 [Wilcoxina mikolae CBS 423.85]